MTDPSSSKNENSPNLDLLLREDLFLSDSDDVSEDKYYEPSRNDVTSEFEGDKHKPKRKAVNKTVLKQQGKKRIRHTEEWTCNVRKTKLLGGENYTRKNKKDVPAKQIKPPLHA